MNNNKHTKKELTKKALEFYKNQLIEARKNYHLSMLKLIESNKAFDGNSEYSSTNWKYQGVVNDIKIIDEILAK